MTGEELGIATNDPNACKCLNSVVKLVCEHCRVYRHSYTEPWQKMDTEPSCICMDADDSLRCVFCGVQRQNVDEPWQWSCDSNKRGHYTYTCRHYNSPVRFPDGTVVYASSSHDRTPDEEAPDFGLYLSPAWNPACLAYLVDWADYHLPVRWNVAADAIIDAYKKAKNGLWVEVGCLGGHGRTGTVLAAMAILGGVPASEAVDWVRQNYCEHAIESDTQEWWVGWFDVFIHGGNVDSHPEAEDWYPLTYEHPLDWEKYEPLQPFGNVRNRPQRQKTIVERNTFFLLKKEPKVGKAAK